jgi:hypothetical protein
LGIKNETALFGGSWYSRDKQSSERKLLSNSNIIAIQDPSIGIINCN